MFVTTSHHVRFPDHVTRDVLLLKVATKVMNHNSPLPHLEFEDLRSLSHKNDAL